MRCLLVQIISIDVKSLCGVKRSGFYKNCFHLCDTRAALENLTSVGIRINLTQEQVKLW